MKHRVPHNRRVLQCAQNDSHCRIVVRTWLEIVHHADLHIHLADVLMSQFTRLKIEEHKALQHEVVKDQMNVEVFGLGAEQGLLKVCFEQTPARKSKELKHDWIAERSTRVDSPIDEPINSREGVCQDFAYTMIALVRTLGIPCRYVTGYLYQRPTDAGAGHDRSLPTQHMPGSKHFCPTSAGFDPTNNLLAHERHIRTALGRDSSDVPPTHGLNRGRTQCELYVAVQVDAFNEPPALDREMPIPEDWSIMVVKAQEAPPPAYPLLEIQQMQHQQ
jgi:hypothetical protein